MLPDSERKFGELRSGRLVVARVLLHACVGAGVSLARSVFVMYCFCGDRVHSNFLSASWVRDPTERSFKTGLDSTGRSQGSMLSLPELRCCVVCKVPRAISAFGKGACGGCHKAHHRDELHDEQVPCDCVVVFLFM